MMCKYMMSAFIFILVFIWFNFEFSLIVLVTVDGLFFAFVSLLLVIVHEY